MNKNSVTIIGRLTDNPTVRNIRDGAESVCNLNIAVNGIPRKGTTERPVEYIPVSVFGKQALSCGSNLVKGQEVTVDGRLHFRKQQIGDKKITVGEVRASHVEFGSKPRAAMPAAA